MQFCNRSFGEVQPKRVPDDQCSGPGAFRGLVPTGLNGALYVNLAPPPLSGAEQPTKNAKPLDRSGARPAGLRRLYPGKAEPHPSRWDTIAAILLHRRQGLTPGARPRIVMRMVTSEEDLARAAAGGDAAAFGALLELRYDGLFRLAFRLTGSRAEAEDLTQDICAALPAKLAGYRSEARFGTWLYRVAVNAAHDRRRRQASARKAADGWGDWELARQAEMAETAAQIDWLTAAMRALPDDLRDTLALVLDDMSHREAGEVLGVSEGTVSWRVSEARKHLRALRATEDQR